MFRFLAGVVIGATGLAVGFLYWYSEMDKDAEYHAKLFVEDVIAEQG